MTTSEDSCDSLSDIRSDDENLNVTHDDQEEDVEKSLVVQVKRPALTQEDFHALYGLRQGFIEAFVNFRVNINL